mmetsp:Transcript_7003/g.10563  ORF Transcript_7003/g.10563 Transcript_7003/m.10563 type:complete len:95 (-) Transcript_7003:65-349(-)
MSHCRLGSTMRFWIEGNARSSKCLTKPKKRSAQGWFIRSIIRALSSAIERSMRYILLTTKNQIVMRNAHIVTKHLVGEIEHRFIGYYDYESNIQ